VLHRYDHGLHFCNRVSKKRNESSSQKRVDPRATSLFERKPAIGELASPLPMLGVDVSSDKNITGEMSRDRVATVLQVSS